MVIEQNCIWEKDELQNDVQHFESNECTPLASLIPCKALGILVSIVYATDLCYTQFFGCVWERQREFQRMDNKNQQNEQNYKKDMV